MKTTLTALAILLLTILPQQSAFSSTDDAVVTITGNEITVRTTIYLYGDEATQKNADIIESSILRHWSTRPDGRAWTVIDPLSGKEYSIHFEVDVELLYGEERASPTWIPGSWNPFSRANYINLTHKDCRPYVRMGDEGLWSTNYYPSTARNETNYAHEFGHLLGLKDRYRDTDDGSVDRAGWEGNIMATGNRVEQKNIDTIARYILGRRKIFTALGIQKNANRYEDEINVYLID